MPMIDLTDEEYVVFSEAVIPFTTSHDCIRHLAFLGKEKQEIFLSAMDKFAKFDHLLPDWEGKDDNVAIY